MIGPPSFIFLSVLARNCSVNRIPNDGLYVLVPVGGIGFVTVLEAEYLASIWEIEHRF